MRGGLALAFSIASIAAAAGLEQKADQARYIEHVQFLASPELEGRAAGTPGLEQAAAYISGQFKQAGLEPGVDGHSYLQPFTVTTGAKMGPNNRLVVHTGDSEHSLKLGEDYVPVNFSSAGTVSGAVVFAGYGASADERSYDDYTHLDVKDKIVLLLRYEPPQFGEKDGKAQRHTHHSHLINKAINARNRGAKAVLLVNGMLDDKDEDTLLKFGGIAGPDDAGILMGHLKNAVAEKWFSDAGKSLKDVQAAINKGPQPQSFSFSKSMTISLEIDVERRQATVHNVVGYLPGKTDEYIVIGAHYDHLGLGDQNSLSPSQIGKVHHGADDNASGTAGLMELARLFSAQRESLERGLLFLAFAGEEIGLIGSSHWVNHPTRPIEQAAAMLNMDMVGRIKKDKVYVGGIGTGSTFESLIEKVNGKHGFKLDRSKSGYSSSDHTSFVAKNVPVLFFFSGLHSDYHKPSDTWDKIDGESAARLVDMVAEIAGELQAAGERPTFAKVAPPAHGGRPGGGGGGYGPWFGSVPDFGEVETGVKFADVTPDSPAAKAGLLADDILIHFGDKPIENLYDFTYALRESKVGDVVEVRVLRGSETINTKVTLERRR